MVSPELLRRYPFFSIFDERELAQIAMATEEIACAAGEVIFEADAPATMLYVLIRGGLELSIVAADRHGQGLRQPFSAGEVNIGEVVGISAMIAPHVYTTRGQITEPSRVLKIDAAALRSLCAQNARLDAAVMHAVAQISMRRLHDVRVQLLSARS